MKRMFLSLLIAGILFAACRPTSSVTPAVIPATQTPVLPTWTLAGTQTPKIIHTATISPIPTKTVLPTKTRTATPLPSPTITPIVVKKFGPHPLALDPQNVRTQMKHLARIGRGKAYDAAYSPDGKTLAVATGRGVYFYDSVTFQQVNLIELDEHATNIAFSPDGTRLAIARGALVGVWDFQTSQKLSEMKVGLQIWVWALVYGRGGHVAAIVQKDAAAREPDPQMKVWEDSTGELYGQPDVGLWGPTQALDISPDGKTIAYVLGDEEKIAIHDLRSSKILRTIPGNLDVLFNPDGNTVFTTGGMENSPELPVTIWMNDLQSGESTEVLKDAHCPHLVRNGGAALCYGYSSLVVFDPNTGTQLGSISLSEGMRGYNAAISPDGGSVAVVQSDEVRIFNSNTQKESINLKFDAYDTFATGLINLDGAEHYVMAGGDQKAGIILWDLAIGEVLRKFQVTDDECNSLAFSPDGATLASMGCREIVRLWNLQQGVETNAFVLYKDDLQPFLLFDPHGNELVLSNNTSKYAIRFNLQTKKIEYLEEKLAGSERLWSTTEKWLTYRANGHLMALKQSDFALVLLDYETGERIELPNETSAGTALFGAFAISPDGNYLAAGKATGDILVWDLRDRSLIRVLTGHELLHTENLESTYFTSLAFNPQNYLLVSTGEDGTTRLWDIIKGIQLSKLQNWGFVGFSPDGRLLTTAHDGVVDVWGIPPWP